MTSAVRPLFAACLLILLATPIEAKTKHKKAGQPMFKPGAKQTVLRG